LGVFARSKVNIGIHLETKEIGKEFIMKRKKGGIPHARF